MAQKHVCGGQAGLVWGSMMVPVYCQYGKGPFKQKPKKSRPGQEPIEAGIIPKSDGDRDGQLLRKMPEWGRQERIRVLRVVFNAPRKLQRLSRYSPGLVRSVLFSMDFS